MVSKARLEYEKTVQQVNDEYYNKLKELNSAMRDTVLHRENRLRVAWTEYIGAKGG